MERIAERVTAVRERIAAAATRAGRDPAGITLVAVSKAFPLEAIRAAAASGVTDIGENRVQEAVPKVAAVGRGVRWHLVGHLQTNKAKKAALLFDRIHSLDSAELAQKLEHYAATAGKTLDVLVQVDLAGETTKHGANEVHLMPLLEQVRGMRSVRATGLMILPPFTSDPETSRPFFRRLRGLRDRALRDGLLLGSELSMGMSQDFEVAVEEGATLVRIGTEIFGERRQ